MGLRGLESIFPFPVCAKGFPIATLFPMKGFCADRCHASLHTVWNVLVVHGGQENASNILCESSISDGNGKRLFPAVVVPLLLWHLGL